MEVFITMQKLLLSKLINQTKDTIRPLNHSKSTLYQYDLAWNELSAYFRENGQVLFSEPLVQQFVSLSKDALDNGRIKLWRYKLRRLAVHLLIEVNQKGSYTWSYHGKDPDQFLSSTMVKLHQSYISEITMLGKGVGTIRLYQTVSRQFLKYAELEQHKAIAELRLEDISQFIRYISKYYQSTSMRALLSALRCFLRYLEEKALTSKHLSLAVPSSGARKTIVIPTITVQEEQHILSVTVRSTAMGKRNYAMVLLALRTGLRSIDIANLKLLDIKWKAGTIEIVQAKTEQPLILPLLDEVGNAMADYILNGRPYTNEPYIFLRTQAPYQKLSSRSACYGVSCKIMHDAGIRQGVNERKGFHCLRHSLAARMLAQEVPLPVISSILGHGNPESTKTYLSTDLEHLRVCALPLDGIEVAQEELL
jgi:site-specific recombinase XerD